MTTFLEEVRVELADNWPGFTYILMMICFSVFFFRERRAERKIAGERFDRLESLILNTHRFRVDSLLSGDTLEASEQSAVVALIGLKRDSALFTRPVVPNDSDEMLL